MTRIAYICTDPGVPVFGCKGCSVHVQEVIRGFLRQGAHVHLFARRFGGEVPVGLESVPVTPLQFVQAANPQEREASLAEANERLPALLGAQGSFDLVYERHSLWSHGAMEWAKSRGVPALLEINAPLVEEQARHRMLVDRQGAAVSAARAFMAADQLVAVSSGVARWLLDQGAASDRVTVVGNGVDLSRFRPARRGPGDAVTAGFVGTLKPWHGLGVLLEAARLVRAAGVPLHLLVVGDGPERTALARDLQAAGLADCSELTGAVSPENVPALLARMDIAVAPYPELPDFYFSPLKVAEYMAAGLAVVASRIGDIDGLIVDDVNGLLCPPGDPPAFAAAIVRLHDDSSLRERLGRAARATAERQLSWDATAARLLRLVRSTVPC
jgi:glycosyltransferase involved in cell wall biosynthesis